MRSVFLYPFEQVVKNAHVEAVMPSYNENNGGIPSHANPWLLREVLRGEWGFKGITASDYTAVEQVSSLQHVAASPAERPERWRSSPEWIWNSRRRPVSQV